MYAYRFGVGIFMVLKLWQMDMWRFFITVVASLGSCYVLFAGYLWLMYPPRRIGLLLLALRYLVHFSLLQSYGLVVGCCVLYWFVEFDT